MNKMDLIEKLSEEENIPKDQARKIVDGFFDGITETLIKGGRVEIRGLCSFHVRTYKAYRGRNPKTGQAVKVESKKLPFFRCGRELRKRVRDGKGMAASERRSDSSLRNGAQRGDKSKPTIQR